MSKRANFSSAIVASSLLALSACVSTPEKSGADVYQQLQQGEYAAVSASISEQFADDKDAFLSLVQRAVVDTQRGDYAASNRKLERAKRLADELYTRRVSEVAAASLTSEAAAQYRPSPLEQSFISYLKAANYLNEASRDASIEARDAAMVELRYLETLQYEKRYLDALGIEDSDAGDLATFVLGLLAERGGPSPQLDIDSPWVYALAGLMYSANGDDEDALRAFERCLDSGEGLSAELKLLVEEEARSALRRVSGNSAEAQNYPIAGLLDVEAIDWEREPVAESRWLMVEQGVLGELQSLEVLLTTDSVRRQILLRPVLHGSDAEKRVQSGRFAALTAEYGSRYRDAIVLELGENWATAESLGLTDVVGGGVRLFLPIYVSQEAESIPAIQTSDERRSGVLVTNFAQALQQHYEGGLRREFEEALVRELSKSAGYKSMTAGISLPFSLGGALATFTAKADLRQCSLLPARISLVDLKGLESGQTVVLDGRADLVVEVPEPGYIKTIRVF